LAAFGTEWSPLSVVAPARLHGIACACILPLTFPSLGKASPPKPFFLVPVRKKDRRVFPNFDSSLPEACSRTSVSFFSRAIRADEALPPITSRCEKRMMICPSAVAPPFFSQCRRTKLLTRCGRKQGSSFSWRGLLVPFESRFPYRTDGAFDLVPPLSPGDNASLLSHPSLRKKDIPRCSTKFSHLPPFFPKCVAIPFSFLRSTRKELRRFFSGSDAFFPPPSFSISTEGRERSGGRSFLFRGLPVGMIAL